MGLFGFSSIVGIVLGIPIGGYLADWLSHRSAVKNNGVHQVVSCLPAVIIAGIVSPLGVLIVGIYLSRSEIWIREAIGRRC